MTNNDLGYPGGSGIKNLPANAGDPGLIPGLERSPGGGHGNPLQYSCLENSMDKGAQWAIVHRVAQSQTQLKGLSRSSMYVSIPIFNLFSPITPQEPLILFLHLQLYFCFIDKFICSPFFVFKLQMTLHHTTMLPL